MDEEFNLFFIRKAILRKRLLNVFYEISHDGIIVSGAWRRAPRPSFSPSEASLLVLDFSSDPCDLSKPRCDLPNDHCD